MIEFRQVSKRYDPKKPNAVDALSLTIESGQIFGFLGPNGAGKSTTIKMLVGMLYPDSGSIFVEGKEVGKDSLAIKRLIAYVGDEPLFYERMTGFRHLNFIADIYEVGQQERKERIAK